MTDVTVWLKKTKEDLLKKIGIKEFKYTIKKQENKNVRNFIIVPTKVDCKGNIFASSANSNKSLKDVLRLIFNHHDIQNIIMNNSSGYYEDGHIVFVQGDVLQPETIKPVTQENIAIIKNKFSALKTMLNCDNNVFVHLNGKVYKGTSFLNENIDNTYTVVHKKVKKASIILCEKTEKIRQKINSFMYSRLKSVTQKSK